MNRIILSAAILIFSLSAHAISPDEKLKIIIDTFSIKAEGCKTDKKTHNKSLEELGDFLFNSKLLSGDNDTSCATCHLDNKHLTDGLPVAIGVGGSGEGDARLDSNGVIVPRNVFSLFGRASPHYSTFFWDGKVISSNGKIYSPIGEGSEKGFTSALALASVLPILARDEFLGTQKILFSSKNLKKINPEYFDDKYIAANLLLEEILSGSSEDSKKLREIAKSLGLKKIDLSVIGNALASFIAKKTSLECQKSPWEKYIQGDINSLTTSQKEGAILFFGKARCATCHSGPLMSDMKFHSIGVPQGEFGTHIHKQDIGRASVTFKESDRFLFRTPPLLGVSKTPPYGHNGAFNTLKEVIIFHINPIPFFAQNGWTSRRELFTYGKIIGKRSETLRFIDIQDDTQIDAIIEFLKAL